MLREEKIINGFSWLNEPSYRVDGDTLHIQSSPDTDFWQRTHYGFRRDNGHCLLTPVTGDFSMTVRTRFEPNSQYDQCGLIVRIGEDTWIKASTEYETGTHSRLGSVVTNMGFSDWATVDIEGAVRLMWYRIQSRGKDFLIEYSADGTAWKQLRIAHLHGNSDTVNIGIYACCPTGKGFDSAFDNFSIEESRW